MSRVALAIQQVGIATPLNPPTMTTFPGNGAGNGFTVAVSGNTRTLLLISNASGGSRTVTIPNTAGNKPNGIVLPSQTFAVPTGAGVPVPLWLGPGDYQDSNGLVAIDIDTAASVTACAIQIPPVFQ